MESQKYIRTSKFRKMTMLLHSQFQMVLVIPDLLFFNSSLEYMGNESSDYQTSQHNFWKLGYQNIKISCF